jgi:hypothetical protein
MRLASLRFTIGKLMVAVAVIAVLLAWLGLWAAIALVGLDLPVIIPATIASPGHRLKVASWASSLQPAVMLFYLYATWAAAWCVLGHRPRSSLDDPKSISPIVDVPYIMCAFSLMLGSMLCAGSGLLLSAVCLARQRNIRPLLALPFAWLAGYLALLSAPMLRAGSSARPRRDARDQTRVRQESRPPIRRRPMQRPQLSATRTGPIFRISANIKKRPAVHPRDRPVGGRNSRTPRQGTLQPSTRSSLAVSRRYQDQCRPGASRKPPKPESRPSPRLIPPRSP